MAVLLTGVALFALSFLGQIALKHVWFPTKRTQGLLILYALVPLAAIVVAALTGQAMRFSAPEAVRLALLYVSVSLAYIALYSAVENQSPTLAIITNLANAGAPGRTEAELSQRFARDFAITGRFAVLEHGGWVRCEGDVIRLTPQGRFYAELFERASRVFGLIKGG
jgi:hypothetical protein